MVAERPNEQVPMMFTPALPDYHLLRPNAVAIPIRLQATISKNSKLEGQAYLFDADAKAETTYRANLSQNARLYLAALDIHDADNMEIASLLWMHALAIGYSPAYLV
jgi:hypothetical protein